MRSVMTIVLLACVAGAPVAVRAVTCYEIVDDSDRTLYRATVPPFQMDGSAWNAAQTRLRAQRHYLMWFDTVNCPEDYSSPAYAATHAAKDASAILSARGDDVSGTVYTGAAGNAPAAAGRAPVYVVPRGGRVALPVGGTRAYGK